METCSAIMQISLGRSCLVLQCYQDKGKRNDASILRQNIFLTNIATAQLYNHSPISVAICGWKKSNTSIWKVILCQTDKSGEIWFVSFAGLYVGCYTV